jgi:hypothetical protein
MSRPISLLALSFLGSGMLFADTVYSTFNPGQSFLIGSVWTIGGIPPEQIAGSFVPSEDFTLDTIDFAAVSLALTDSRVEVSLAAGPSAPGASIESFTIPGISPIPAVYSVNSALHPILDAHVKYWIGLSPVDQADPMVGWDQNDEGVVDVSALLDGGSWMDKGTEVLAPAFDVLGSPVVPTVPEPSSWSFLILPMAMQYAAFMRRRSKTGRL